MMPPLLSLLAASLTLVGTHLLLSHSLRGPLVRRLGEPGFLLLYSAVALAAIWWMACAFRAAPAGDLGAASGTAGWIAASVLTVPALVLFLGSLRGNPAFPQAGISGLANRAPHSVFRVTRHPMMWSFALWALSHLALLWSWRTSIVAGAVLILAGGRGRTGSQETRRDEGLARVGGEDQLLAKLGQAAVGRPVGVARGLGFLAGHHLGAHPARRHSGGCVACDQLAFRLCSIRVA
jgi:uncharacterized membrane protein